MVMFWCLDDFTTENGGTHVIPGSHRWPAEHLVKPPSRDLVVPINAPAGSVFAWDGRLWHGTGPNLAGEPRRSIGTFWCLPWMRQQENWVSAVGIMEAPSILISLCAAAGPDNAAGDH